ncbi:U3 small nucleolar RNA-associated protein 6, putative [Angomonas deanei]|uniref:U3 small nucleolar RNA-associated protein 6, putative n=1 Tax=Angomonas deanei TaxID=59799 RepID=A0A7G2CBL9_9TRYP|nr:U3 small nucleolar RNA-associated protein 6, putative [Angomonas deanei]
MSRARAVETRIEKLLPSVEEYYHLGFFSSRDEIKKIMEVRTQHEYKLIAKPLLYIDVQQALQFELELEDRLRDYLKANKIKKNVKHRWAIVERAEYIYKIGLKHLRKQVKNDHSLQLSADKKETNAYNRLAYHKLRREYILFLQYFDRRQSLSQFYAEMIAVLPTDEVMWCEAALHECYRIHNINNARQLLQKSLLMNESKILIWKTFVKVELAMVDSLLRRLAVERREEKERAAFQQPNNENNNEDEAQVVWDTLKKENETFANLIFELELVKSIIEQSFQSAVSGPAWLRELLALLTNYHPHHEKENYNNLDEYFSYSYYFTKPLIAFSIQEANKARQQFIEQLENNNNNNKNLSASDRLNLEKKKTSWGVFFSDNETIHSNTVKNGIFVVQCVFRNGKLYFWQFS